MSRRRIALTAVTLATAALTYLTAAPGDAATEYFEDFSDPASMDDFVFHVGNACSYDQTCRPENLPDYVLSPEHHQWPGDHNMACEAPTTARTVHLEHRNEMFYHCAPGGDPAKGHMMTSMDTTGYAIMSFSPDQTFTDVGRVCWDINATNEGGGKWTNVIIVPEAEYLRHPNNVGNQPFEGPYRMDYVTPGFNVDDAPGDFNIQVDNILPGNEWFGWKNFLESVTIFRGNHGQQLSPTHYLPVVSDKAARYKHCMIDTAAGIQVTKVNAVTGGTEIYNPSGWDFPRGRVRVIFQDDMYDPPKRPGYNPNNVTWHWDNIEIGAQSSQPTTTTAPSTTVAPTTTAPTTTTTAPTTTTTALTTTTTALTTTTTIKGRPCLGHPGHPKRCRPQP